MKKPLSELQQKVYDLLAKYPDEDVMIRKLYAVAYHLPLFGYADADIVTTREMQQRLGPIIQRINRKLGSGKVVPGETKRTYRLDTKG